jgi:hypothetical protein
VAGVGLGLEVAAGFGFAEVAEIAGVAAEAGSAPAPAVAAVETVVASAEQGLKTAAAAVFAEGPFVVAVAAHRESGPVHRAAHSQPAAVEHRCWGQHTAGGGPEEGLDKLYQVPGDTELREWGTHYIQPDRILQDSTRHSPEDLPYQGDHGNQDDLDRTTLEFGNLDETVHRRLAKRG